MDRNSRMRKNLPPVRKGKQPNRAERRAMANKVAKRLLGTPTLTQLQQLMSKLTGGGNGTG